MDFDHFMQQFSFDPTLAGWVGVERECLLMHNNRVVPIAPKILLALHERGDIAVSCELSACQLETKTRPARIEDLRATLEADEALLTAYEQSLGISRLYTGLGPENMPLDIYPEPRYIEIARSMSTPQLRFACRALATHYHVGMPDAGTALRVYNHIVTQPQICELGDLGGGRADLYRHFVPHWRPRPYESWGTFHSHAIERGFAEDPRKNWALIRLSPHGTVEFRMPDATSDLDCIVLWGTICHRACMEVM